jgi:hypothetical protein
MLKRWSEMVLAAGLVAVVGCGGTAGDPLSEATPDVAGLTLEMTGAPSEQASAALTAGWSADAQNLESGPAFLAQTRDAIQSLNTGVKALLAPITALAQTQGSGTANVKIYGPEDRGNATYLLTVKRAGLNYWWKLEAKGHGAANSDYQTVASGHLKRGLVEDGEKAHRGRGVAGFDFDRLAAIDSSIKPRGRLLATFAHAGEAKMVAYRLDGFTDDPATRDPLTATFYGHKNADGVARVRVGGKFDALAGPNGKELLFARAVTKPGFGGHADVYFPATLKGGAANGDVPAGRYVVGHSCWDTTETENFKLVLSCEAGKPASTTSCTVLEQVGARANCKPGVETDQDAPATLDDATPESGAPGAFDEDPPSAMPQY